MGEGANGWAAAGPTACFGELLLRLSAPGRELLLQTPRLEVNVAGAEANVAVALACLGHRTRFGGVVADNPLGHAALGSLRGRGVDVDGVALAAGRMGLYFLAPGAGGRASEIVYDRADSAFARAGADAIDFDRLLGGAGRLHLSGITPALGPGSAALAQQAVAEAQARNIPISFDGNYRARLWESWAGDPAAVLRPLVAAADILFGNHRDIALLLGRSFEGDGPARARDAADAAFAAFPRLRLIASTTRHAAHADRHLLSARIDAPGRAWRTEDVEVAGIVDRIGAGDAFAAGVLHGLSSGEGEEGAMRSGLALACLKHTLPGDQSLFGVRDIAAFWAGERDVRR